MVLFCVARLFLFGFFWLVCLIFGRGEMGENIKDNEELEMLLGEIPHATSHNIHHHHHHPHQQHDSTHHVGHGNGSCITQTFHNIYGMYDDDDPSSHCKYTSASSPVSGLPLRSDVPSSALCSGGNTFSDYGSPTPPPLEGRHKPYMPSGSSHYADVLCLDSQIPDSSVRKKTRESLIDELGFCRNFSKVYFGNGPEDFPNFRGLPVDPNRILYRDCSFAGSNQINIDKHTDYSSDYAGFQSPVAYNVVNFDGQMSSAVPGWQQEYKLGNPLGPRLFSRKPENYIPQSNYYNSSMNLSGQKTKEQIGKYHLGGSPALSPSSMNGLSMAESLLYGTQDGINLNEERGFPNLPNSPQLTNPRTHLSVENILPVGLPTSNGRTRLPSNLRISQEGIESLTTEESFIIQGKALNHGVNWEYDHTGGQTKGALDEMALSKQLERSHLDIRRLGAGICQNSRSSRTSSPFSPPNFSSLTEAQGYIYLLAKDQHGCRFLQRIFDEGTPKDVQIVFSEIIDHVVELMVNPFGNYLMQKLLEVCSEEQRKQILLMVTEEPGQLVRISLNIHGTRVVQKLIETLKTRHEISLVISALEPGFLALIKDLNGNHVVQRCLQCLSIEDNKFIFVAAAKFCVDIATHRHGCCVLQRCITHSTGEHQQKLIAEISANGLLLAQDAYGNYVVQYVLDLGIPSATSTLTSQFEGNYVHLSTQKFSSHVVEKCLDILNYESRSRIIHELLSVSHFEQLLQDPHANYVVQTAVRVSEGPIHNMLVEAIESHKAISRNSPYSKRICSQKLLKK